MAYLIDADTLRSNDVGYRYDEGEDVTVASGILVSSTELSGVYSEYANSRLFNYGHIISTGASGGGLGVLFDLNDGSAFNAAGASITGFDIGVKFYGDRLALFNDGTVQGLRQDGVFVAEFADDGIVNNIGTITGPLTAIHYSSSAGIGQIVNAGVIRGGHFGILYDGTQSTVTGTLRITNAAGGVIAGSSYSIGILEVDNGKLFLDNRGILNGDVGFEDSFANNVVLNRGLIRGTVRFDEGNDFFNGAGGRSGAVLGASGRDTLAGGAAADRLSGGPGADILTGRGGADRFVFDATLNPATNTDRITDFAVNVDKIILFDANGLFATAGPSGVLAAARFHIGPTSADASDRIIYNPNTGALFYDHDGRGGDAQLRFAQLAKHLALDHADFVIAG